MRANLHSGGLVAYVSLFSPNNYIISR